MPSRVSGRFLPAPRIPQTKRPERKERPVVRRLLLGAAEFYSRPGKPGGCLFVIGAIAASPQAQDVAEELKTYRKATEAAIAARLVEGQAAGDFPADVSVQHWAKYLTSVMHGMSIQARDGASAEELRALAQTALTALPIGIDKIETV